MRIQQIRFKNLNSLCGEWQIDLTHSEYTTDGIFAITGPTGSGKTTILDAICLALYGRTPRLEKINSSVNEIMSRRTGECFAEVTFTTATGRFRCYWGQHRARKKPSGELQLIKHEVANADTGTLLESKNTKVKAQIEQLTGMDFDQFTRSMLLAQGGFAAFLQAKPDERSPILEQITGTEIYSKVSIRVHERRSEERKRLDILEAELSGMQALNEEETQELNTRLDEMTINETVFQQQIKLNTTAINWLESIDRLASDLQQLDEQKQILLTRQTLFKPKLAILNRAKQAMELAVDYKSLTSLRETLENNRRQQEEYQKTLPEKKNILEQTEQTLNLTKEHLLKKRNEQASTQIVIRNVRALDLIIQEKTSPINSLIEIITKTQTEHKVISKQNNDYLTKIQQDRTELELLLINLDERQTDEALIEQYTGIAKQFDTLIKLDSELQDKSKELRMAKKQINQTKKQWLKQIEQMTLINKDFAEQQQALDKQNLELNSILENKEISDLRSKLSQLKEKKRQLEKITLAEHSIQQLHLDFERLEQRQKKLISEQKLCTEQLQIQTEHTGALEREKQLLETQLGLLNQIKSFAEVRDQLHDGETCPLCGSMEHPFSTGKIPIPDETSKNLKQINSTLEQASVKLSGTQIKQAEIRTELDQIGKQQNEINDKINQQDHQIQEDLLCLTENKPLDTIIDLKTQLENLQQENASVLKNLSERLISAESHEKKIHSLRSDLDKTKDVITHMERETQTCCHIKDTAKQTLNRVQEEHETLNSNYQQTEKEALHCVSVFNVKSLPINELAQIQLDLHSRREQWIMDQKKKDKLKENISTLEIQIQHQKSQIFQLENTLNEKNNTLHSLQKETDTLKQERYTLYSDKDPETEEIHLSEEIEKAEQDLEQARHIFQTAAQASSTLKNNISTIETTISAHFQQLTKEEPVFITQLKTAGFTDEADFLSAILAKNERHKLNEEAQQLETEHTEIMAKSQEKKERLTFEQQRQITQQTHAQTKQALDTFESDLKVLQQEIGGIQQKLKDDEELQKQQKQRLFLINAQKKECKRWNLLHDLIGSSDGKKYRNFAQGLTFEILVGHANQQLQKLTDRYLLIRDEKQRLEFNVIDNYQSGEIRSTKNLSGGESFIISLSLALGLSHMASKNVRVDSLFLDEGFGTLDEKALDTALETLSSLQQGGKLIGVISHVATLKERISTQIQVSYHANGKSLINGPGCTRL